MNPETLVKLDDEEFRDVVDKEVRNDDEGLKRSGFDLQEITEAVRSDLVRPRWITTLTLMKKSVESQIGSRKADVEKLRFRNSSSFESEYARYNEWRAGALRFKSGVEARLMEAKAGYAPLGETNVIRSERNEALRRVSLLEQTIRNHQKETLDEFDPSKADEKLWKSAGLATSTESHSQ